MIKRLLSNKKRLDLTKGNTVKNIWSLAFPIMFANILQTAFNVVDMIWVGRLGPEAIASVAMSGVVLLVIAALIMGLSTGTEALVARFTGAKKQSKAENVAEQSLIIGAALSLILVGIGLIFPRSILLTLGAKDAVLQLGTAYLKIILTGGMILIYSFLITAIFRAAGDVLTPMLIMIGATVLNIVLDPLMIFGIGFPRMGVAGAALSTVISRSLAAFIGIYILFRGSSRIKLSFAKLKVDYKTIIKIIKLGFPNTIQLSLRHIVGLILMAIVAKYGSYAIAAYGIGLRIFSVVLMPGFALATSATTLVGQNLGAKQFFRARTCAWQAAGFNALLMGLAGILFFIFSGKLVSVFSTNPEVIKLASGYLKITSLGYIFIAQGIVLGRSLMGAGDTISPMVISIFALLGIQIPLAILFSNHLGKGLVGIWWAILISSILQGILVTLWFNLGRWQSKEP